MQSFLIAALGLAILTVIFALAKSYSRWCDFLVWTFEGSLALVLMLTFALGALVSSLVSIPAIVKRRSAISNQKKKIEELENRLRGKHPTAAMKTTLPSFRIYPVPRSGLAFSKMARSSFMPEIDSASQPKKFPGIMNPHRSAISNCLTK